MIQARIIQASTDRPTAATANLQATKKTSGTANKRSEAKAMADNSDSIQVAAASNVVELLRGKTRVGNKGGKNASFLLITT
jgi:hypothetical protein